MLLDLIWAQVAVAFAGLLWEEGHPIFAAAMVPVAIVSMLDYFIHAALAAWESRREGK